MGYPLYRGRDNNDQLVQIMKVTGTPSEETWAQIRKDSVGSSVAEQEIVSDILARDHQPHFAQTRQAAPQFHYRQGTKGR
jgi:hypothetical protein